MIRNKLHYIIKFKDETYLTKPSATPYSNYYKDHATQYNRVEAFRFNSKLVAYIVKLLVGGSIVTTLETPLRYEVGKSYMTIGGDVFTVTEQVGDCIRNAEGYHCYNRLQENDWDGGRMTGSPHTKDSLRYPPVECI